MVKRLQEKKAIFIDFFKDEASSGVILLLFAIVTLLLANSSLENSYNKLLHLHFAIGNFNLSLLHWINDALMSIFFFVVGLEIKREFLFGELKSLSATILPIAAAIGGMIVPALLYLLFNFHADTQIGWGIPMATDIAFSLGVLTIAAKNAPRSVVIFLTALAIVDDLGAIIVIALFYSTDISFLHLGLGLLALLGGILLNRCRTNHFLPYLVVGIFMWIEFFKTGIHPTIAGVALGLLIPAHENADMGKSLLHSLEHRLAPLSSRFIMPIFALANAGVTIDFSHLGQLLFTPVTFGIICGLFIGKPLGIFGMTYLMFKTKLAFLPENTRNSSFLAAGTLGGIGFTMSLFIATLAFAEIPEYLSEAKIGIITASVLSGLVGFCAFKFLPTGGAKKAD